MPPAEDEQQTSAEEQDSQEQKSLEKRERRFRKAVERLEEVQERPVAEQEEDELEQAIYEASLAWLRLKWGTKGRAPFCPYCNERHWAIEPPVSLVSKENSLASLFPVICAECGHTTFVAAKVPELPFGGGNSEVE